MIAKREYIEYLLSTPFNYTCTNMADHKPNLSHDVVSDFLRREGNDSPLPICGLSSKPASTIQHQLPFWSMIACPINAIPTLSN
uniref:hypothetical protein n=1 Tax=Spirosoma profusum TaxID=2771354 RepID=UPI001CC2375E|nr:hypothetical protein [Spirosoma profusum]